MPVQFVSYDGEPGFGRLSTHNFLVTRFTPDKQSQGPALIRVYLCPFVVELNSYASGSGASIQPHPRQSALKCQSVLFQKPFVRMAKIWQLDEPPVLALD